MVYTQRRRREGIVGDSYIVWVQVREAQEPGSEGEGEGERGGGADEKREREREGGTDISKYGGRESERRAAARMDRW